MKAAEIRELTKEELVKTINDKRKELFSLRLQVRTGQLKNTASISTARKDIARLLSALATKEL